MDGLTLLRRARDAGLAVAAESGKLVVRGPRRAEAIARLLIEHKPEVMTALVPEPAQKPVERCPDQGGPAWWRRHYIVRTIDWELSGVRPECRARGIAWGELLNEWHRRHGTRVPRWQCAGCGEPIGGLAALDLADSHRLHFDKLHCVLRFGERWRSEAAAGLRALGLDPPQGFDLF
jgi:hypothetical protein